jgi:GTP-binding protein
MPKKAVFVGSFTSISQIPSNSLPHIAFAGRSNVGKSTLLNSLVGQRKLARTSKTPGRTQALNFFLIDDRYYFVDLPGYGYARAPLKMRREWGILVDKYVNNVDNLCGMIFLIDCRRDLSVDDRTLLEWLDAKKVPFLPVLTKADKLSRSALIKKGEELKKMLGVTPVFFSALRGFGKDELVEKIETLANARRRSLPEE